MNYWLVKSEPSTWSWEDQLARGDKGEHWDGVRNYQAANNLKAMRVGDLAFFYHSVKEKSIVGIVRVTRAYYPDPSDEKGRFGMVDVAAEQTLPRPVTLAQVKAEPRLAELALVKQSRLSVMPIDEPSWMLICKMGGLNG